MPVTTPMVLPRRSSSGPCSIWASTKAATGKPTGRRAAPGVAASAAGSRSPTRAPPRSRTAAISARPRSPAKASDPIMPGAKREPSSLSQATTSIGRRVRAPAASSARSASSPASTPKAPSNLPPVGWLSICEPVSTGASAGSAPSRRTNRLAASSTKTAQPSSAAHSASRARASNSSGLSAWRSTPPLAVAPIRASSIWRRHSRASSTEEAALMPRRRPAAAPTAAPTRPARRAGPAIRRPRRRRRTRPAPG